MIKTLLMTSSPNVFPSQRQHIIHILKSCEEKVIISIKNSLNIKDKQLWSKHQTQLNSIFNPQKV